MKHAYFREGIVEFIEERPNLEQLYPAEILKHFVSLDEVQEKEICQGYLYNENGFTEPEMLSEIPNIGGYYKPLSEEKFESFLDEIYTDLDTNSKYIEPAQIVLTDKQAVKYMDFFNEWKVDRFYSVDARFKYQDRLYKCIQAHTSQADWTPDITPSLWAVIDMEHAGTIDDPIPAVAGMEYTKGKYYIENDVIYLMNREGMADGESIVLYYVPSQLVGQYFEIVE